jgi:hypothetical protein
MKFRVGWRLGIEAVHSYIIANKTSSAKNGLVQLALRHAAAFIAAHIGKSFSKK